MSETQTIAFAPVARLVARAELARATLALCRSNLGMLRRRHEAEAVGVVVDDEMRERIVTDNYMDEVRALVAAWQRGASRAEHMRVVETAVRGYAEMSTWMQPPRRPARGYCSISCAAPLSGCRLRQIYPAHARIRKSLGEMTRKLSVTSSQ